MEKEGERGGIRKKKKSETPPRKTFFERLPPPGLLTRFPKRQQERCVRKTHWIQFLRATFIVSFKANDSNNKKIKWNPSYYELKTILHRQFNSTRYENKASIKSTKAGSLEDFSALFSLQSGWQFIITPHATNLLVCRGNTTHPERVGKGKQYRKKRNQNKCGASEVKQTPAWATTQRTKMLYVCWIK